MEVSQLAFAFLCIASFLGGAFIGLVHDAFAVLPVIFGKVYSPTLREKLSKIKMPYKRKEKGKKSIILPTAVFVHDFFTVIAGGILMILVIYRFNDGQMRIASPICFGLGFFLYRITFSGVIRPISELTGFFLRYSFSCLFYLLDIPKRIIVRLWIKIALKLKRERIQRKIDSYTQKKKEELCISAELFGCSLQKELTKHGKKKSKYAGNNGDSCASFAFGNSHSCEHNAVQSKARRGGKA